jgi:SAM-dependent methyltransferase
MKQQALKYIRKVGLIPVADYVAYLLSCFKTYRPNQTFSLRHSHFKMPPLSLAYDAYAHTNWQIYYESGLTHAKFLASLILQYGTETSPHILDWGCGPGRIIRHLPSLLKAVQPKMYGTDYNARTIDWLKSIQQDIHFSVNQLDPPLSFSSEYFDVIYSISVFTHLSEKMFFEWLKEIKRLLKPEGIFIFTGRHLSKQIASRRALSLPRRKNRYKKWSE